MIEQRGKRRKSENKERKIRREAKEKQNDMFDFNEEKEEFGDFQEAENSSMSTKKDNGIEDLIGGNDNEFGDFVMPESSKKEDDFGDFISSENTAVNSIAFGTSGGENGNLVNNLSNLYSQTNQNSDPDNKYAALENIGTGYNQPQPQMYNNMGGNPINSFPDPFHIQNTGFHNTGFPSQSQPQAQPQSWATSQSQPTADIFSQNQFSAQTSFPQSSGFAQSFSNPPAFTHTTPTPPVSTGVGFKSQPAHSVPFAKAPITQAKKNNNGDLFGLKATLKEKNKIHKYNNEPAWKSSAPVKSKVGNPNAFSGLVSTQWNS